MVPFQLTTADSWTEIACPSTTRVTLQVSGASVAIGYGTGTAGQQWSDDEPFLPVVGVISRRCDRLRIRSLNKGIPAVVLGSALTDHD